MIAPGSVMVNDFVSPLIPVVDLAANQTVSRYDKFEDLSVCRTSDEFGVTKVNCKESIYRLHVTLRAWTYHFKPPQLTFNTPLKVPQLYPLLQFIPS